MLWFHHDTDAASDPKVQRLLSIHGVSALGLYWTIVEAIFKEERPVRADDLPALAHMVYLDWDDAFQMVDTMVEIGILEDTEQGLISHRAEKGMERYREVCDKRRSAAQKRWSSA